jgi:hypothetical protein
MRAVLVAICIVFAAAEPANAQGLVERCGFLVRDGEEFRFEVRPGFSVANATHPLTLPEGFDRIAGVVCGRVALRFEENDYRVITDLSVPFNLTSDDGRLIVLEMSEGQFRARMLVGELTEEEAVEVQAALHRAQLATQAEQP